MIRSSEDKATPAKNLWWIPDENEVWTLASQVSDELPNGCVNFLIQRSQRLVTLPLDKCLPAPSSQLSIPEDLVYIPEVNAASILSCIRARFVERKIYTNIGMVLMAVNPFEVIPGMYGRQMIDKYENPMVTNLPAHVYVIASRAFHHLCQGQNLNQSILISGESGAGKTEATKQCLSFLAELAQRKSGSSSSSSGITDRILFASPILEAFGNAKTLRNNNSSRFGKWMVLNFDQHNSLHSSNIVSYLLEKSRVTQRDLKERNYHIFYQLLRGVDRQVLQSWNILPETKHYRFLQTADEFEAVDLEDQKTFNETYTGFLKVGFTHDETMNYMKVIAAILQLGNVVFTSTRDGEACDIKNREYVNFAAEKLGINAQVLSSAMCSRSIESGKGRKSIISIHLSAQKAQETRDTLARFIYDKLFHDIIDNINTKNKDESFASASRNPPRKHIGLLDIFGFEIFVDNSFEQLCINYCNEMLQYHFNFVIFTSEKNLYAKESIFCETIEFRDNIEVIRDIEHLFKTLDEEARIPKGSSKTWYDKLKRNFKSSHITFPTRRSGDIFVVKHYAGDVDYTPLEFMDKNIEVLNNDLLNAMVSSKDPLIFRLFTRVTEQSQIATSTSSNPPNAGSSRSSISVTTHDARPGTAGGANGSTLTNKSISWRFIHQLSSLTAMLKDTQSHFIRCVKSNDVCQPQLFDSTVVFKQLTYSGIFEVVKIQQSGLPCRLTHSAFLTRYRCLAPGKVRFTFFSSKDLLKALQGIGYDLNRAKIGTNLTFFSSSEQRLLEKSRDSLLEKSATLISRFLQMTTRRYAYRFIRLYYKDFQIHNANLVSEPATVSYEKFCESCARMDRLVRYSILERQMRLMKKHLDFLDARVDLIRLANERLSEKTVEAIISLNEVIAKAIDLEITEHPVIVECRTIIQKYNRTLEFLEIVEQTESNVQEEEEQYDENVIETESASQKSNRIERGKRRMSLNHLTKSQLEECIASLSEFKEYIPKASEALQTTLSHQELVEKEMREVFYPLQESLALAETVYDEQTGDLTLKFGDEGAEAYLRLQRLVKQHEVGGDHEMLLNFKGKDCALLFEDCRNFIRLMEEYVASNEAYEAIQFMKSTSLGKTNNEIFLRQLPQLHLWAEVQLIPQNLRDDLLSHHMIPKSDIANEISDVMYQQLEGVCQKLQKIDRPSEGLFIALTVAQHFVILRKAFVEKNWRALEEAIDAASTQNIEKNLFDDYPSCYDELHHAHWQISYHTFLNDLLYSISEPIIQSISLNMDLSSWIVLVGDLPEDLTLIQEIKSFANAQNSSKLLSLLPLFESILQLRSLLYSREIPFTRKILATFCEEHSLVISEYELLEKIQLELQHCEKLVLRLELEERLETWLQNLAFDFSSNAINPNVDALPEIETILGEFSRLSSNYHPNLDQKIRFCQVLVSGLRRLVAKKEDKMHWSEALLAFEEEIFRTYQKENLEKDLVCNVFIFDLETLSTSTSLAELFLSKVNPAFRNFASSDQEQTQSGQKDNFIEEKDRKFFVLIALHYQLIQFELFRRYLFSSVRLLLATEGVVTGNVHIDLSVNTVLHGDSVFQLNELTQRIHQISKYTSVDASFSYAGYGLLYQLKFPTILCIAMPDQLQYLLQLLHRHYSLRQLVRDNLWEIPHPDPHSDSTLVNPLMTSLLIEISSLLSQSSGIALSDVNFTILTREVEKIALELKSRMVMKAFRHELENIKIENITSSTSSMRKISISLGPLKAVMKMMEEFSGPESKRLLQVSTRLIRLIDLLLSNQIDKIHQKDLDEVIEEFQLLELNPDQVHQIFHQVQIHNFLHELNEIIMLFKNHHHNLHLLLKSIHQLHKNLLKILHVRQSAAQAKSHSSQHHHYHHWKCLLWLKASYFYCNLSSVLMHYPKPALSTTSSSTSSNEYNWIRIIESCNQLDEFMQIYLMPLFYEIIRSKIKHLPHQGLAQATFSLGVRRRDSFEGLKLVKQENRSTDVLNDDSAPSTLDYTEDVVKFMELCIHLTQEGYQFALRIKLQLDAKAKQASLSALSPLENLKKEIRDFDLTANPYSFGHLKLAGFSNQQIVQSLGTRKALTSSSSGRQIIFDAKLLWAYNVDLHLIKKFASSTYSSRELLLGGYSLKELYNCGYTPAELYASELVSIQDLLNIGLSITQLRENGISDEIILREITDLATNNTSSLSSTTLHKELKGFSLSKLLSLGYKLHDLRYFNFSLLELRAAGFTAEEIHRFYQEQSTTSSPPKLPDYVKAGFSSKSLLGVFSLQEFRRCQYSFEDLRKIGVDNDEELFFAGYVKELEYEALSMLYQSCHGAFWKLKTNWNNYEVPLSQWFGVSTSYDAVTETERVCSIELINNNLRGFLPSELCNLKKLQKLRLSLNNISNDLPPKLKSFLLQNQVVTDFIRAVSSVNTLVLPSPANATSTITPGSSAGSPLLRSPPPPSHTSTVQERDNDCKEDEETRKCLRELFHALGGRKWKRKDNWCSDETLTRWYGVKVDQKGRVIELNLGSNNLQGSIPNSICALKRLKILDLRLNQIGGFIPPSLAGCHHLERIHLQSNKLCGHLPENFQDLSRLRILDLRSNLFNGISAHIFHSMKEMQYLGLHSNKFLETDLDDVAVILPVTCKLVR